MIAKVVRGRGFGGLARYLESGKSGEDMGRIAWTEARNLPSDHPRSAALSMRATAAQSPQVKRPVYHLSLAWDPEDTVSRAQVVAVADRVLQELGLEGHQVLMVAHRDTKHPHVHLMINRVHQETGRAWAGRHDYRRLEEILRPLERELGFREVPGHHGRLPGQAPPDRSQSISTSELRAWERTGQVPFAELVRDIASRDFAQANSWEDLEARLARHGLRVEARGRGMVVTDGREAIKCSAVAREASRVQLEKRFGERYVDHQREPTREAASRDRRTDARDRGGRSTENRVRERGADPERSRAGCGRSDVSGRADGAGRDTTHVGPGGDGGTGDGRRGDRRNDGASDPAVDRVRRQVEQLERQMKDPHTGGHEGRNPPDRGRIPGQHSRSHAIGRAVLALAPRQLQLLHEALSRPQRALIAQAVRTAKAFLLDQERER